MVRRVLCRDYRELPVKRLGGFLQTVGVRLRASQRPVFAIECRNSTGIAARPGRPFTSLDLRPRDCGNPRKFPIKCFSYRHLHFTGTTHIYLKVSKMGAKIHPTHPPSL